MEDVETESDKGTSCCQTFVYHAAANTVRYLSFLLSRLFQLSQSAKWSEPPLPRAHLPPTPIRQWPTARWGCVGMCVQACAAQNLQTNS